MFTQSQFSRLLGGKVRKVNAVGSRPRGTEIRVPRVMLSKTQVPTWLRKFRDFPQQLGTQVPNGPKIPLADKGLFLAQAAAGR